MTIPIQTLKTMIDQTNNPDELLELIQTIQKQHEEHCEKYYQINENLTKNLSMIEIASNEKLMKELDTLETEISQTVLEYKKLLKYAKEKCSKIRFQDFKI